MIKKFGLSSGIIDTLSTNYPIIAECIVQLARIEITIYFLSFYQFPLEQKLISLKIREYTNNTISGGSTIPTYFFDPPVLDISVFQLRTNYYESVTLTFLKLHMSDTLSLNSFLSFPFILTSKSYCLALIILWIQDTPLTFCCSVMIEFK